MRRSWLVYGLALWLAAGCAHDRGSAPGGGGGQAPVAAVTEEGTPHGSLAGLPAGYISAFARAPWVEANVASGDYALALDDLQIIQQHLDAIALDRRHEVPEAVRARIAPLSDRTRALTVLVQKHLPAALDGATDLVTSFGVTTRNVATLGWLARQGGGAGTQSGPGL